jgi:hypothetical protein
MSALSRSTTFIDVAVGVRYHILGSGFWDPWIDAGAGWGRWFGAADPGSSSDSSYDAALVRVAGGLDIFITQFIALGLRVDVGIPIWLSSDPADCGTDLCFTDTTDVGTPLTPEPIERDALPLWWGLSLGGTLYFTAI